ncbi:MAG: transposase [Methylocella sp.]
MVDTFSREGQRGYDTDAFRAFLGTDGIKPVIPRKSDRTKRIRHDKKASKKKRNVIAGCLGTLKDVRRIATRHDKLAGNFFSALYLVAIAACWL